MTVELWMLAASIALGMIHLIVSSHLISWQRGYRWTASSREDTFPPLHGVASRVDQAATNFLETFPFFAALVLLTHVINHHSALTIWGVHLYFWARVAYLIAAATSLGLVRSLLCWNTAFVGLALLFVALF